MIKCIFSYLYKAVQETSKLVLKLIQQFNSTPRKMTLVFFNVNGEVKPVLFKACGLFDLTDISGSEYVPTVESFKNMTKDQMKDILELANVKLKGFSSASKARSRK